MLSTWSSISYNPLSDNNYELFLKFLIIYLWLCWVFVSVRGLSLVVASGGHSSSWCVGLSLSRPLLLWSTGSRRAGSVIVAHGSSCSTACGIFPDQGSNPCPLHWQADSQPLRHLGSPLWTLDRMQIQIPEGIGEWAKLWGSRHMEEGTCPEEETCFWWLIDCGQATLAGAQTGGWSCLSGLKNSRTEHRTTKATEKRGQSQGRGAPESVDKPRPSWPPNHSCGGQIPAAQLERKEMSGDLSCCPRNG